jgi:REP element-mobilizing transposase RayT
MEWDDLQTTRRHLPHWKRAGSIYWITFRMADSIPAEKLRTWVIERDQWKVHHPEPWDEETWKEHDRLFGESLEKWMDAGHGSCVLARPELREHLRLAVTRFDGQRLDLHAAVIMPNHVHLLLEPLAGHDLSKILKGIKGASARSINGHLGVIGTFWMDESYDHIVRSEIQYERFRRYIAENPSKARLRLDEYWLYDSRAGTQG